jgi:hypothetical protein
MTTRTLRREDIAVAIIHDTIAEYKSQHGVARKKLSRQQRREIGEAKVSYTTGNLNEQEMQRTVEHVLNGAAAMSEASRDPLDIQAALVPPATPDDTR